jgi:hypothetical protein
VLRLIGEARRQASGRGGVEPLTTTIRTAGETVGYSRELLDSFPEFLTMDGDGFELMVRGLIQADPRLSVFICG